MIKTMPGAFENEVTLPSPVVLSTSDLPVHRLESQVITAGESDFAPCADFPVATHAARLSMRKSGQTMANQLARQFQRTEHAVWGSQSGKTKTDVAAGLQQPMRQWIQEYMNNPDFPEAVRSATSDLRADGMLQQPAGALKIDALPNPWEHSHESEAALSLSHSPAIQFLLSKSSAENRQQTTRENRIAQHSSSPDTLAAECASQWQTELESRQHRAPENDDDSDRSSTSSSSSITSDSDADSAASEDWPECTQQFTKEGAAELGSQLFDFLSRMDGSDFLSQHAIGFIRNYAEHFGQDKASFVRPNQTEGYHYLISLTEQIQPAAQFHVLPYLCAFRLLISLSAGDENKIKERINAIIKHCPDQHRSRLIEAIGKKIGETAENRNNSQHMSGSL